MVLTMADPDRETLDVLTEVFEYMDLTSIHKGKSQLRMYRNHRLGVLKSFLVI
jgi:hypothetical protein